MRGSVYDRPRAVGECYAMMARGRIRARIRARGDWGGGGDKNRDGGVGFGYAGVWDFCRGAGGWGGRNGLFKRLFFGGFLGVFWGVYILTY